MADLAVLGGHESALAQALLPDDPEPTAALEPRSRFLVHAYLVLACATIEEFIEGCFEEYVAKASDSDTEGYAGCFLTLAARFADDLSGQHGGSAPPAAEAIPVLRALYLSKVVSRNNGVKSRHLAALSKPLGLQARLEAECEDLLVPADALGAKRGAVAHLGTVDEVIRPAEAREMVENVIDNLHLLLRLLAL
jgi:hypothetical protein